MDQPRVLTCVYCGMEYPQGTKSWGDGILTAHIAICEKHPMRAAEEKIKILRSALVGLIGVDGKEELEAMEAGIRVIPCPEQDRINSLNAIHALLTTLEA